MRVGFNIEEIYEVDVEVGHNKRSKSVILNTKVENFYVSITKIF